MLESSVDPVSSSCFQDQLFHFINPDFKSFIRVYFCSFSPVDLASSFLLISYCSGSIQISNPRSVLPFLLLFWKHTPRATNFLSDRFEYFTNNDQCSNKFQNVAPLKASKVSTNQGLPIKNVCEQKAKIPSLLSNLHHQENCLNNSVCTCTENDLT